MVQDFLLRTKQNLAKFNKCYVASYFCFDVTDYNSHHSYILFGFYQKEKISDVKSSTTSKVRYMLHNMLEKVSLTRMPIQLKGLGSLTVLGIELAIEELLVILPVDKESVLLPKYQSAIETVFYYQPTTDV